MLNFKMVFSAFSKIVLLLSVIAVTKDNLLRLSYGD